MIKFAFPKFLFFFFNLLFVANFAHGATVHDYGDKNISHLKNAYQQGNLHILQIGDSHTAGDYFTEQLRKRLQRELGDGGLGFAYPDKLKGQRNARHGYSSSWDTDSSKHNKWGGNYPIGGVVATANSPFNRLTLTSQYYAGDTQTADIVVYGDRGQQLTLSNRYGSKSLPLVRSGWQTLQSSITFPTSIQADTGVKIGGFWLKHNSGGIVSAMGINGSTQDYWNRWRSNLAQSLAFSQADLVILAYGTNEAFRSDASSLTTDMNNAIRNIRQGLPNASILIVGAPESLKSTKGQCGRRSTHLDSVQYQLRQTAQNNHTLYWDWQEAMGGRCSMKSWVNQGLAVRDGVHFQRAGYNRVANDLYNNLKPLLTGSRASSITNYYKPIQKNYYKPNITYKPRYATKYNPQYYRPSNTFNSSFFNKNYNDNNLIGQATICDQDGNCQSF
ncbi:MAG: hypothetical protein KGV51_03000 [Moraxellaceae bacterium]|nr:hypothetical protein [Moraxellaceae bacterium]